MYKLKRNKDENVHRYALSAIRGDLLEGEREKKERKREREVRETKSVTLGKLSDFKRFAKANLKMHF